MNARRTVIVATAAAIAAGALATLATRPAAARPASGLGSNAKTTVITVTAGKPSELRFTLSKSSAIPAGTVIFKVTNRGKLSHDFKLCTAPSTSSKANSCSGRSTKLLKPGQSASLTVTLKKTAKYEFLCPVPGHAAAGMKGLVSVTAASTTGAFPAAQVAAGKALFHSSGCGNCHTLKAAASHGAVGPNLDSIRPSYATIVGQVTNGGRFMPPFAQSVGGALSPTQVKNVAAFVYASEHA